MSTWIIAVSGIGVAFVLAHFVARRLVDDRRCKVGHGREVMPTFVRENRKRRGDEKEWKRRVRGAEQKILDHFEGDAHSVSASELATELGELPVVMAAALDHMRQEIPCRIGVTHGGELLHDFDADDLEALRDTRRRGLPKRIFLRTTTVMANISAIWPVVVVAMLAAVAFYAILHTPMDRFEDAFGYAFFGILIVAAGILSAWGLSTVLKFFARPFGQSVGLDFAHTPMRTENPIPGSDLWSSFLSNRMPRKSRPASSRDVRGGGGGGFGPHLIIVAIYIVLATVCLFTLYVWVRGMVRAIRHRDDPREEYGPASWIRHLEVVDWFERFLPTNDLISRMVRAQRRVLFQRRPSDLQLSGRILENTPMHDHKISALDMALAEALNPAEVAELGVELCRRTNGEVHLADGGEVIFALDEDTLKKTYFPEGPTYEYLERKGPEPTDLRRRIEFPGMKLPVNLVGLKYAHLKASNFLVGGSILMFLATVYVFTAVDPTAFEGAVPASIFALSKGLWPFGPAISAVTWLIAVGTVCLAVSARYLATASAIEGVQRDARRIFAHVLRDGIDTGEKSVNMNPWIRQLRGLFEKLDSRFDESFFREECVGLLVDFDLYDATDDEDPEALNAVDVTALRKRLDDIRHTTTVGARWDDEDFDDDDVLFESLVDHDEVRAL